MNKKNSKVELGLGVMKLFETPPDESFKFGYYNLQPVSADGGRLLAHKIPFEGRLPTSEDKVEIGYFSLSDGIWHKIADTSAFNWQQGSMLQWLGPDFNEKIIFNDADKEERKYVSRIADFDGNMLRTLPYAVYAVHPSGDYSISLNFERCNYTRAYGYASVFDEKWNCPLPEGDGVLRIDLVSGEAKTIIRLADIVAYGYRSDFEDTSHWLEHIMLNPSGTRFAFYHRYQAVNGFSTRVFTADPSGNSIWCHNNRDTERVTHLGWRNNEEYVIFTISESRLRKAWIGKPGKTNQSVFKKLYRKVVKPLIPRKVITKIPQASACYALTNDLKGFSESITVRPENMDGHPSFTRCGQYMLSDTYADRDGFRNLILHDLASNTTRLLGRFFSFYNNSPWRCDLHPRFGPDEKTVIVDSNHAGNSQILVLQLNWDLLKNDH